MHRTEKSKKTQSLLTKTENQRLNSRKPTNRGRPQTKNRNFQVWKAKNWSNPQSQKSQNPPPITWSLICTPYLLSPYSQNSSMLIFCVGGVVPEWSVIWVWAQVEAVGRFHSFTSHETFGRLGETPIRKGKWCLSENLNLTPKEDQHGRCLSFTRPLKDTTFNIHVQGHFRLVVKLYSKFLTSITCSYCWNKWHPIARNSLSFFVCNRVYGSVKNQT